MGVAAASACLPKVILEVSLDGVLRAVVVQPSQEHLAIGDILGVAHVHEPTPFNVGKRKYRPRY